MHLQTSFFIPLVSPKDKKSGLQTHRKSIVKKCVVSLGVLLNSLVSRATRTLMIPD